MDETLIIKNVRRLSKFLDDAYLKSDRDKFFYFQSDFRTFHQTITAVYDNWFPDAKPCKDEDIINQIFRDDIEAKDLKMWAKYSIACLLQSSQRVFDNILECDKNGEKDLQLCEMRLLKEMSFESAMLMESAFNIIEKKQIDFGHGKRFNIHARETFNASRQILRRYVAEKTLGDFVLAPTSIFLIRQSVELWLKGIFGINFATDDKNKLIKLQPERLFDLIDNKGEKVKLPIPKSVIVKIHNWSQPYVHAGWMPWTWETEHAQFVLHPIFNPSNIEIKKDYHDDLEKEMQNILSFPTLRLSRLTRTESKII